MFKDYRSSILEMINQQCDKINNMFYSTPCSNGVTCPTAASATHNSCGAASTINKRCVCGGGCGGAPALGKKYLVSINRCTTSGRGRGGGCTKIGGEGQNLSSVKMRRLSNDETTAGVATTFINSSYTGI